MTVRYAEIDEVISFIHQHIYDPLPLARLARHVDYSPYHFTRIFKERIGLSPLYYVSSLRLQKAKELLLRTGLSVRDVGLEIGQQSLGTFTTRFTERVGMTPSEFRSAPPQTNEHVRSLQELDNWREPEYWGADGSAVIEGAVGSAVPFDGFALVGLFAKPIPEGFPLYGTLVAAGTSFRLTGVKPGTYYLMATSISWGMQALDILLPEMTLRTRAHRPLIVYPYAPVPYQQVTLHPPRPDDPPILVSLPLLMNRFLERVRSARESEPRKYSHT
ncbi:helix-turn-helix transcriptional regulator [Paenibacillus chartarius]|uniref:Helix-turn-helix transcriptional regulator n=1 Tax=Paenibacillus chartarius TaxID=747481 RepID=A0ABV6DR97_9BACL